MLCTTGSASAAVPTTPTRRMNRRRLSLAAFAPRVAGLDQTVLFEVVERDHDEVLVGQLPDLLAQHLDQIRQGPLAVAAPPHERRGAVQPAGHVALLVVHEQLAIELLRQQIRGTNERTSDHYAPKPTRRSSRGGGCFPRVALACSRIAL